MARKRYRDKEKEGNKYKEKGKEMSRRRNTVIKKRGEKDEKEAKRKKEKK